MAVPLWRLKMTKIKTLRVDGRVDGRTGGRTGGITLRGPRGPKNYLLTVTCIVLSGMACVVLLVSCCVSMADTLSSRLVCV